MAEPTAINDGSAPTAMSTAEKLRDYAARADRGFVNSLEERMAARCMREAAAELESALRDLGEYPPRSEHDVKVVSTGWGGFTWHCSCGDESVGIYSFKKNAQANADRHVVQRRGSGHAETPSEPEENGREAQS